MRGWPRSVSSSSRRNFLARKPTARLRAICAVIRWAATARASRSSPSGNCARRAAGCSTSRWASSSTPRASRRSSPRLGPRYSPESSSTPRVTVNQPSGITHSMSMSIDITKSAPISGRRTTGRPGQRSPAPGRRARRQPGGSVHQRRHRLVGERAHGRGRNSRAHPRPRRGGHRLFRPEQGQRQHRRPSAGQPGSDRRAGLRDRQIHRGRSRRRFGRRRT